MKKSRMILALTLSALMLFGTAVPAEEAPAAAPAEVSVPTDAPAEAAETPAETPEPTRYEIFAALLRDVLATQAGSAGSSTRVEAAAAELLAFAKDFGESGTLQELAAEALTWIGSAKTVYGADFDADFTFCFGEVTADAALTDAEAVKENGYTAVINAVYAALERG